MTICFRIVFEVVHELFIPSGVLADGFCSEAREKIGSGLWRLLMLLPLGPLLQKQFSARNLASSALPLMKVGGLWGWQRRMKGGLDHKAVDTVHIMDTSSRNLCLFVSPLIVALL